MTFDEWFDGEGYDDQHRLVFGFAWNAGMDCSVAEINDLREELAITDKLLKARQNVIDAIPPCEVHGTGCLPGAMEWIKRAKAVLGEA